MSKHPFVINRPAQESLKNVKRNPAEEARCALAGRSSMGASTDVVARRVSVSLDVGSDHRLNSLLEAMTFS